MSRLEALISDTLVAHEGDAPEGANLVGDVRARAAHHRAGQWGAAGLAAAAVILVILGVAAVMPAGGNGRSRSPVAALSGTLTQSVSYHGVEVRVPASWRVNDTRCGTPMHDTVLIEDGSPTTLCGVLRPPDHLTVVRLTRIDSPEGLARARVANIAATVTGRPAMRGTGTPAGGEKRLDVLVLPTAGVVVSVEAPNPATAQRLLATARLVHIDDLGCLDRVTSRMKTVINHRFGGPDPLVPGRPSQATICRYSGDWLARSVRLAPDDLAKLVSIFNSLPPGVSQPGPEFSEIPNLCAQDVHRMFLIRFDYPAGSPVVVVARIGGCKDLSARSRTRTSKINGALVKFLISAAGYDGGYPDPRNLR